MIGWLTPLWFAGLITLPLIWWLHRRPHKEDDIPVSSLLLWRHSNATLSSKTGRALTDPLWWLRAALITLLILAGADPTWQGRIAESTPDSATAVVQESENSAVTLLSLRPSMVHEQRLEGLITVAHQGKTTAQRELTLLLDEQPTERWSINIAPGGEVIQPFHVTQNDLAKLTAQLTPADAINSDDQLTLTRRFTLPVLYNLWGECDKPVQTVLASLPLTKATAADEAELNISCGHELHPSSAPTLWIYHDQQTLPVTAPPLWRNTTSSLQRITLPEANLQRFASPTSSRMTPILTAGDTTLIEQQEQPQRLIRVLLDITSPTLTTTPEYPLFIAGLLEQTLSRPLLDRMDTVQHPITTTAELPAVAALVSQKPASESQLRQGQYPLAPWLIVLAALLFAVDIGRSYLGYCRIKLSPHPERAKRYG